MYRSGTNKACSSRPYKAGCHAQPLCWFPIKCNQLKLHFKHYHLLLSSHYWNKTHHSPTRLGGHYHINSVHANSHDVNDSLPCFSVGQAEDAQGLKAGGIAVRNEQHRVSSLWACAVFSHPALRKLPPSNLLVSTPPLTPNFIPLLLSSE